MSLAAAVIGFQLGAPLPSDTVPLIQVQQQCGDGYDIDIYGRCYPNGVIPPRYQAARQGYRGYGGGRYSIPCGNGADVDIRDGLCYRPARCHIDISRAARVIITIARVAAITDPAPF
jgi:hypothetical protein